MRKDVRNRCTHVEEPSNCSSSEDGSEERNGSGDGGSSDLERDVGDGVVVGHGPLDRKKTEEESEPVALVSGLCRVKRASARGSARRK